jgi:hypothetical protein
MGWFADVFGGGKKQQELPMIDLPEYGKLMTGAEAYGGGADWAKSTMPTAYGSREMALGIQQDPAKAMQFYSGFQPTNFEQGISGTYFQDMLEQAQRAAGQRASLSGNEQAYAPHLARALSPVMMDIGTYLGNQGQTRANYALQSMMNVDPMSMISPYANLSAEQNYNQVQGDYDAALQQIISNYVTQRQNDERRAANKKRSQGALGNFLTSGPIGGAFRTQGLGMSGQEATDLNMQIAAMGLSNYLGGGMSDMFPQKKVSPQSVYGDVGDFSMRGGF